MAKGFDTFSLPENEGHGRAAETVLEAVEWMESENFEEPFLMVFHVFDPHLPYEPPPPYDTFYCDEGLADHTEWRADETGAWYPQQRQHMIDLYNGEIRWTDSQIGTLLAELRRRGLEDRTLVILTADHGEEFLEHGHWGHGPNLYQQSLHVPLIFSGPEIESRVDSTIVGQYDILPTVLDYCGIDVPDYIEGVSLLADGPSPERPVPSSAVIRRNDDTVFASVRQLNMKAIWSPVGDSSEFYDLGSDPLEQDPAPTDSMLLEEVLLYWASPCICEPTELERERIQARLRGLGYID